MSNEEQIAAQGKEIAQLRADLAGFYQMFQETGGAARAFQSALLAVIASHPDPVTLAPCLDKHLARVDAEIVAQAQVEAHLRGFQDAHRFLIDACYSAQKKQNNLR